MHGIPIEGERVVLRDLTISDWPVIQEYARDPNVTRLILPSPQTPEQTKAFVQRAVARSLEEPRQWYELAIVQKIDARLIGDCRISIENFTYQQGSMGCFLRPEVWNLGFSTEVCGLMLRFGFERLGLHRMWAACDAENRPSGRSLERNGMRREATFRESVLRQDGFFHDTEVYAILKDEWTQRTHHLRGLALETVSN